MFGQQLRRSQTLRPTCADCQSREPQSSLSGGGYNIFEVTSDYIARPDLVSYNAYGDSTFTDIICKLNGISNPFELNVGMKLILPTPEDIQKFIIIPSIKDKDENWGPNTPSQAKTKTKTSKRQANEAIVGDTRFKIDKANRIIIY